MRLCLRIAALLCCYASATLGADPTAADAEFFEQKIRPLLQTHCASCHGGGELKGGLSIDSEASLLKGGDSGEAILPGKPDESLLIEAVGYATDIKMPPKQKLAEQEIADLTLWVAQGAVWPRLNVTIPLGNLFDDDKQQSLGAAIVSDAYKAAADATNLGVDRVVQGWGTKAEIAPGVRFDFSNLGSDGAGYAQVSNDAWSSTGPIRTQGKPLGQVTDPVEQGIGMHANALVTFDLKELRAAGGMPDDQAFLFRCEKAGLNDDVFGNGASSAHVIVLVSAADRVLSTHVNGAAVATAKNDSTFRADGAEFAPLKADGKYATFEVAVPAEAQYLTLAATGAGIGTGGNSINSDHTVFSGARLEFTTSSSVVAAMRRGEDAPAAFTITAEQRNFWSFRPIADPAIPAVQDAGWPKNSVDFFVLRDLEQAKLQPVAAADKLALIRRASFDLIGLPPTPEEVDAFVRDESPEAFAHVVDRLLASPHYGERWGRYWLDVARYAEDQAHTFQARMYPEGFRYRDWVVRSFNNDRPFDQFVREQIAGDLLDGPDENDRLTALGYFALGPVYYADAGCAPKAAADELDDRIDTLSRGFLGLTVSCARCHDHKFDPISQQDYYALGGIFRSTNYREAPLVPQDVVDRYNAGQDAIKKQDEAVRKHVESAGPRVAESLVAEMSRYILAVAKFTAARREKPELSVAEFAKTEQLHDFVFERWVKYLSDESKGKIAQLDPWFALREKLASPSAADELLAADATKDIEKFALEFQQSVAAILTERNELAAAYTAQVAAAPEAERGKVAKPELDKSKAEFLNSFVGDKGLLAVPRDRVEKLLSEQDQQALANLKRQLEALKKEAPPKYPLAHSLTDGKTENMPIYIRGNPAKTGSEVPRRFLSVLTSPEAPGFSEGSGRRQLAEAIASPDNPLTARVFVNRVWQHHFGRGLVGTPSNFGLLGERPTHPELLDHLARQFMQNGWSVKGLHRLIMLSSTYQLSTAAEPRNMEADPENRLLWRMNRRRLDVEAWRDALLAVAGNLDGTIGGPSGNLADNNFRRRTLYGKVSRHELDNMLRLFDFPDPNITSERRTSTTVPLQQLFVLNGDFLVQQARALATRLNADSQADNAAKIAQAFQIVYARPVTSPELEIGLAFLAAEPVLDEAGQPLSGQLSAWEQYAQVLLSANEFTFLD